MGLIGLGASARLIGGDDPVASRPSTHLKGSPLRTSPDGSEEVKKMGVRRRACGASVACV